MRYLLLFLIPVFLFAHALKVFTSIEDNTLKIKSYFTASSPCKQCKVTIETKDKKYLEYKTSNKGEAFIPLELQPISILVVASLGHQKSITLDIEYEENKLQKQPLWLKLIAVLGVFVLFFAGLRWIKRK